MHLSMKTPLSFSKNISIITSNAIGSKTIETRIFITGEGSAHHRAINYRYYRNLKTFDYAIITILSAFTSHGYRIIL